MRLVFAGTPAAAVPSLRALIASRHEVLAVVTRPDAPAGRGRRLTASPIAELAAGSGLEILRPKTARDPGFLARLTELAPQCCPVVAYGGLVPRPALDIPAAGWVNLHFSLLPAWRGAAPVQRALIAGDEVTGATTFHLVEQLDAGPTYGTLTETIRSDDTAGALLERLAAFGAGLLLATLDAIEDGTASARPQAAEGVSWAPKLTTADAEVDWTAPAFALDRLIRGCTPTPAAWTLVNGQRCKLGPVFLRPDITDLAAGELAIGKSEVLVGTATSAVQLRDIQAPGRPLMSAAEWGRGLRSVPNRIGRR
ncbi:MAG: methionyl-tRNA formyltransferase [Nocardioidaceae bacterium]